MRKIASFPFYFLFFTPMPLFGIISALLGITLILKPEFLAYIVGFTFLFVGINAIVFGWMRHSASKTWTLGNYEIIKKK